MTRPAAGRLAAYDAATVDLVLAELARDRSVYVRFRVTANAQFDADLAQLQADDPAEDIRQQARARG